MACRQRGWMAAEGRKERKTEGVEPGIARWAEERGRRRVCKLAADKQMESARWALSKVCRVRKGEYNGV